MDLSPLFPLDEDIDTTDSFFADGTISTIDNSTGNSSSTSTEVGAGQLNRHGLAASNQRHVVDETQDRSRVCHVDIERLSRRSSATGDHQAHGELADERVASHFLKCHRASPVLVPDRRVRLLHHPSGLSRVDVVNVELIGVPAFNFAEPFPAIRCGGIIEFVAQPSDRRRRQKTAGPAAALLREL